MVTNVLHMNAGNGGSSYANNSILQKIVISKVQPILTDTIKNMYSQTLPECFNIAELGCASGPNSLSSVSNIMDAVSDLCLENNRKIPEFHVSLNDLPENDFNNIFKSLPAFYDNVKKEKGDEFGPCFISGMPGSFYDRIFPSKSLHFVHSSYSVHWLSQVPEGLENNKENIYLATGSPPDVFEAYLKQFQRDFSSFLRLRSHEIVPGGRMVLTLLGRSIVDFSSKDGCGRYQLLGESLAGMVKEGIVVEADLFSFNIPMYLPYKDEVEAIIQDEGSFNLDKLHTFRVNWDVGENDGECSSPKTMADGIRAFMEPMLASHFGDSIIHDLFIRYADLLAEVPSMDDLNCFNIVVSLTKK